MIELRAPRALSAGDVVLLWWPDWHERRAIVVSTRHFQPRLKKGQRVADEEVWRIMVRWKDGEDTLIDQAVYRGDSELVPVIVKRLLPDEAMPTVRRRPLQRARRRS